jgi:hypothetical protein
MVLTVPEKIKLYNTGDCVEVSTWAKTDKGGFFHNEQIIGLILEAEYIEMGEFDNQPRADWMYRVSLPDGTIAEIWDYEIRPVNTMCKEYNNNISHKNS